MIPDDRSLAVRSQQGDRDAFGELVRRHQAAVFNVAYRLLGNRQDAEDAAQETFIRAYRAFATFDAARPLAPWLKKIAANVCYNRLQVFLPPTEALEEDVAGDPPAGGRAQAPDPESAAQQSEAHARLRAEILRLPLRYRLVIELRHFQALSYEEIAAAVQRPLSDVKSDLFRARRLLAERLDDLDIDG
jgi:RNA polymerase sigma-70 factor, ECF subfamily